MKPDGQLSGWMRCGPVVSLAVAATSVLASDGPKGGTGTDRVLRKEVVVRATLDDVWKAWTTPEGIASFFSPESNIELRVGGPYELFMGGKDAKDREGRSGTHGCRLLSYLPKEMLSFEWSFPPKIPSLRYGDAKTHVVLLFDDPGDGTVRVRFAQLGWQEGEDWERGYAYFDQAWDGVFEQFGKRFGAEVEIRKHERVFSRAVESAPNKSHVAAFAPFVGGEWHAIGTEPDGGVFHPKVIYEWGLDGKLVRAKSFVVGNDGEKLAFETVCGWHPKNKTLVFRSFSAWDSLYDGTVRVVGDTFEYEWDGLSEDKVTRYRQKIRILDDNRYLWTVFAQTDDGWEQIKEMTYHREPS